jgi:hypothetical protein
MIATVTRFKSNLYVQHDVHPFHNLTIKRKAFANNTLMRHIATINAFITSDRLTLEDQCFAATSANVSIIGLEEKGWDPKNSVSKNITTANLFTQGKGILPTKTLTTRQTLAGSSIGAPKTMAQLITQSATLATPANALTTQDYLGSITLSNAAQTVNATTAPKYMGANAFASCPRLASVRLSSNNTWNAVFSDGCFKSCSALTTINTVTNSNSNMSNNLAVVAQTGTISCSTTGSATIVNGSGTAFITAILPGQMLYASGATRDAAQYIGTVASVQSNTVLMLNNPSKLDYSGTWRLTTEALIPAHVTAIGKEALRATGIRNITFESHMVPSLAASNSRLTSIGTNFCTDCPNLTSIYFSVKQSNSLALVGAEGVVVPSTAQIITGTNDGWANAAGKTQLVALFKLPLGNFTSLSVYKYIAALDPNILDATGAPTRVATIIGLACGDGTLSISALIIPTYIMHTDEQFYEVMMIDYVEPDQSEVVINNGVSTELIYGAFSKSNAAFSSGDGLGELNGTLSFPTTMREIRDYSFINQRKLNGNLIINAPKMKTIGVSAFENSYNNDRAPRIVRITNSALYGGPCTLQARAFYLASFTLIDMKCI